MTIGSGLALWWPCFLDLWILLAGNSWYIILQVQTFVYDYMYENPTLKVMYVDGCCNARYVGVEGVTGEPGGFLEKIGEP